MEAVVGVKSALVHAPFCRAERSSSLQRPVHLTARLFQIVIKIKTRLLIVGVRNININQH